MSGNANKDLYSTFVTSGPGSFIASRVGLPQPPNLRRYSPTQAPLAGPVVLGGEGRLVEPLREAGLRRLNISIDTLRRDRFHELTRRDRLPEVLAGIAAAAASGLRPIAELMFVDFIGVAMDQLFNQAAKMHYMFGGHLAVPMVLRTASGSGSR